MTSLALRPNVLEQIDEVDRPKNVQSRVKMLNEEQQKAVHTVEGKVLILAGAGSGKTSVITHRIAHLLNHCGAKAESILGLTFTNKAAEEMRKRIAGLVGAKKAKELSLCTFHSFCMQILRKEITKLGYTRHFSLYDEKDVRRLVTQLARHLLEHEGELPSLQTTLDTISLSKNKALHPDEMQADAFSKDLIRRLEVCMRAYNAVDFDSLLSLTLQLFQDHPETLATYQDKYHYIMIDEYQDTNPVQYKLADLLSQKSGNLCVVGDDDQAIYGWRGAEIKNILGFPAKTLIKLQQNYRSTPTILEGANSVIRNNQERHAKELWSSKEKGKKISIFHAPSDKEEAEGIVQRLVYFHQEHQIPWNEMAILYRSNILSRPLEMALMQASWKKQENWVRGIPYQIFGGTEFYERTEIKDLSSYLRAILNPLDQEALLRIINTPRRGISDEALDKLTQKNRKEEKPLWEILKGASEQDGLSSKALQGIHSFVSLLELAQEKLQKPPYAPTVKWLLEEVNYKKAISEDVKSDKMRAFKEENLTAFIENLSTWEQENTAPLTDFLGTLSLDEGKWGDRAKSFDQGVNLMTFHSAKGLEFKVCFLSCLEDHILPHEKSVSEGGLEEERRLMYVAMTRAKERLILSMARSRKRYGKDVLSTPSRFLFEIPADLLKTTIWNRPEDEE